MSFSSVCVLSHVSLRRAEMMDALEKQQLLDIDFSTQERVSYSELVELEVAAGYTTHHATVVPCICGRFPANHPIYGEYR